MSKWHDGGLETPWHFSLVIEKSSHVCSSDEHGLVEMLAKAVEHVVRVGSYRRSVTSLVQRGSWSMRQDHDSAM